MVFFPLIIPLVRILPYWFLRILLILLADALRPFDWRTKVVAMNLRIIYPSLNKRKLNKLVRQTFRNFYLSYLRMLKFRTHGQWKRAVDFTELEPLKGKKAVLFSIHMGPWDIVASRINKDGYRVKAVMEMFPKPVRNIIEKYRGGVEIYTAGEDTLKMIRELKKDKNFLLVILIDRVTSGKGEIIEFMGRKVMVPVGAFKIPKLIGAEPYFAVSIEKKGTIEVKVHPLDLENAKKECLDLMKRYLKKYPDQWFNFYFFTQKQT